MLSSELLNRAPSKYSFYGTPCIDQMSQRFETLLGHGDSFEVISRNAMLPKTRFFLN